jgi:tRNA modification GTPase
METLLSCLTPPGKAAIATLAVRGPKAWEITRQLFVPRKGSLPDTPTAGKYWYGKLGKEHADDAILAVKQDAPTVCLELHCHGGSEVVRMVQDLYAQSGVSIVPWKQFLDGPAELLDLLARAPTTRTASILLDQANGAWQSCLQVMHDAEKQGVVAILTQKLRRLDELIPLGLHLVEPWKIVVAGAPNVGKSSLINALAGYIRSIVSPIPGTTRDVVSVRLAIDGWPVQIADTAGIRTSSSKLEQQGILRAQEAISEADLRFWLLDGSLEPTFPNDANGWHFLITKIDLPAAWDYQRTPLALRISAQTQGGLAELCDLISRLLVPRPPAPGEAVPCSGEQIDWVVTRSGLPVAEIRGLRRPY